MDPTLAALLGSIGGAMIGGPIGFLFEKFVNRARLSIRYAETCYEDVISLPLDIVLKIGRYHAFVNFVESQVKWHFIQRIQGNLFSREELFVIQELGIHFFEYQQQILDRMRNDITSLNSGSEEDIQRLVAELHIDYQKCYNASLAHDISIDQTKTINKLSDLLGVTVTQFELGSNWLNAFLEEIGTYLKSDKGTSERIIVRVGIANNGHQNAVLQTEAQLKWSNKLFRLPIQIASRPWESEKSGVSRYHIIESKTFHVLEFIVDERLNATADIDELKKHLKLSTDLLFQTVGIGDKILCEKRFRGMLD